MRLLTESCVFFPQCVGGETAGPTQQGAGSRKGRRLHPIFGSQTREPYKNGRLLDPCANSVLKPVRDTPPIVRDKPTKPKIIPASVFCGGHRLFLRNFFNRKDSFSIEKES